MDTAAFIQKVLKTVPAYKILTQEAGVGAASPFTHFPIVDKDSYLRRFSFTETLSSEYPLTDQYLICSSSGSTGIPTIWPRNLQKDTQIADIHTAFLHDHFSVKTKPTLVVVLFGLGTTIAGMLTSQLLWLGSQDAPISSITAGTDVASGLEVASECYSQFEQVILIGYPPLIEEWIEVAKQKHISLKNWKCHVVFTSAQGGYEWRSTIQSALQSKKHVPKVVGMYGCAEAGLVGVETPRSEAITALAVKHQSFRSELFPAHVLPTLIELDPSKHIELVDSEVIISVDQAVPLIRYNLHDLGTWIEGSIIQNALKHNGLDVPYTYNNSRFLALFGRAPQNVLAVEDLNNSIQAVRKTFSLSKEFQYKDEQQQGSVVVTLVVYATKRMTKQRKTELEAALQSAISQQVGKKTTLKLSVLPAEKQRGFSKGKLQYFL